MKIRPTCCCRGLTALVCGALVVSCLALLFARDDAARADSPTPRIKVARCDDFEVTGDGSSTAWNKASWTALHRRGAGAHDYTARFKTLRSWTGLYFLMEGTDSRVTAEFEKDFENLWTEDVFEVFLWTDERHPIYFEYEISPLNRELPIIIPNLDGKFLGWRPWHYEGERRTRKATSAIGGGKLEPGSKVDGWRAEFFIPFALLTPLQNVPPKPGSAWRANFYRVDYDGGKSTGWDWARVGPSFHEYRKFGVLEF